MTKIMRIGKKDFEIGKRTYIMGILNVTPDSFSDGGKYNTLEKAIIHTREMIEQGADIINDIWGFKKDPDMARIAAKYNATCLLMHNRDNTDYGDLIKDVLDDLRESINIALSEGVKPENIRDRIRQNI